MQAFLILLLTIYFPIIKGDGLEPYTTIQCKSKIGIVSSTQTVILDLDENFDEALKTCIIKNANSDHSVILISDNSTKRQDIPSRYSTSDSPNVVIMTKEIKSSVLDIPAAEGVLRSHRSLLFILGTDSEKFKCTNGQLNSSDFLYLENFMNDLWHSYKIANVGVRFSLSCGKLAVYSGKRNTNQRLYDRTIKLIDITDTKEIQAAFGEQRATLTEDYTLVANIFERYPTSIRNCDKLRYYTKINLTITDGFCGLDALIMYDIIKHFKFKILLVKDEKCSDFGYNSATNLTGSLGCIIRQELDLSFNSRFMTMYSNDHVYFLHFNEADSLCVLLKQADVIPIWYYAISAYSPALAFIILCVVVVIGIVRWKTSKIYYKIKGCKGESLYFYIKDAFISTMFGISNNTQESRILRSICLFSSIMFIAIYQGHVNHIFTTLTRYDTIKTLDELYKSDTNLYVTPSMKDIVKQLVNQENQYQHNFMNRITLISDKGTTLDLVIQKHHAAIVGRKKDVEMEILHDYTENDKKKPLINVVEECLQTFYLSFIGRSGFPFVEELQRFMQRVREAGLAKAYYIWMCNMLKVPTYLPKLRSEPRPFASIELQQLRLAFAILVFGQAVSLIIFIVELWKGRRYPARNN